MGNWTVPKELLVRTPKGGNKPTAVGVHAWAYFAGFPCPTGMQRDVRPISSRSMIYMTRRILDAGKSGNEYFRRAVIAIAEPIHDICDGIDQ
jgi:hypothetical protein